MSHRTSMEFCENLSKRYKKGAGKVSTRSKIRQAKSAKSARRNVHYHAVGYLVIHSGMCVAYKPGSESFQEWSWQSAKLVRRSIREA